MDAKLLADVINLIIFLLILYLIVKKYMYVCIIMYICIKINDAYCIYLNFMYKNIFMYMNMYRFWRSKDTNEARLIKLIGSPLAERITVIKRSGNAFIGLGITDRKNKTEFFN